MDGSLMVGPALDGVVVPGAAEAKTKADSPAPVSTGSARTHEVQVKDSSFTPATLPARVGDTISWVNLGKIPHTVTAKDHSFDKTLKPGQRFNLVLTKAGTIPYVCTPTQACSAC
jgi:plastocyanin